MKNLYYIGCSIAGMILLGTSPAKASTENFYLSFGARQFGELTWDTSDPGHTWNYSNIASLAYRMSDLAMSEDGLLFGITQTGEIGAHSYLSSINPTTGAVTLIGDSGYALNSLTFDFTTGVLYGAGTSLFGTLDLSTGAFHYLGNLSGQTAAGDLAFNNGSLYVTVGVGAQSSKLERVNPANGALTLVGPSIGYSSVYGMDTGNDGNLYGFKQDYVFQIDPVTGESVLASGPAYSMFQMLLPNGGVDGATRVTSVPEPSSLALFATASMLAGSSFRRRRLMK